MLSMKSKAAITVSVFAILYLLSTLIAKKPKGKIDKPDDKTKPPSSPDTPNNHNNDTNHTNSTLNTQANIDNTSSSSPPTATENSHDFTLVTMDEDIQMEPINTLKISTIMTHPTEIKPQALSPIKSNKILLKETSVLADTVVSNNISSKRTKSKSPQRNQAKVLQEKIITLESKLPLANKKDNVKSPEKLINIENAKSLKSNIKVSNGSSVKSREPSALKESKQDEKKDTLKVSPVKAKESLKNSISSAEKLNPDQKEPKVLSPAQLSDTGVSSKVFSSIESLAQKADIQVADSSLHHSEMEVKSSGKQGLSVLQSNNENTKRVPAIKQTWNVNATAFVPSGPALVSTTLDQGKKKKKTKVSNEHTAPHHTLGDFFSGRQNQQQNESSIEETQTSKCIFGSECHNKNCTYFHPTEECKFGQDCKKNVGECMFVHSKGVIGQ